MLGVQVLPGTDAVVGSTQLRHAFWVAFQAASLEFRCVNHAKNLAPNFEGQRMFVERQILGGAQKT